MNGQLRLVLEERDRLSRVVDRLSQEVETLHGDLVGAGVRVEAILASSPVANPPAYG
jgi:hypothetical protein